MSMTDWFTQEMFSTSSFFFNRKWKYDLREKSTHKHSGACDNGFLSALPLLVTTDARLCRSCWHAAHAGPQWLCRLLNTCHEKYTQKHIHSAQHHICTHARAHTLLLKKCLKCGITMSYRFKTMVDYECRRYVYKTVKEVGKSRKIDMYTRWKSL